jgi:hypothetical protein
VCVCVPVRQVLARQVWRMRDVDVVPDFLFFYAAGAASSTSCSVAKPLHQAVQIPLTCDWISWISYPATLSLLRGCARRCTLSPLTLLLFAIFAFRDCWILSPSYPLVLALFALLCALFLPAMSCWLGLLLLMQLCLLVTTVCCCSGALLLAASLVAALVPCCRALPPLVPPFWGC